MCVLWEGKGGRAAKTSLLLTCFWVWANETSPSEPSFHQRWWGRTADEDLGWGFVASENHSPLGSFYIFICKAWSPNLGSLKERMPFNPSRYSVFNLNFDTETIPQIKKVFLKGCIFQVSTVEESVCTKEGMTRSCASPAPKSSFR